MAKQKKLFYGSREAVLYWLTEYEERLIDARLAGDTHRQRVLRGRIRYLHGRLHNKLIP